MLTDKNTKTCILWDTSILWCRQCKQVYIINDKLNQDFNTLCDWFLDNKLSIHFGEEKTKTILFSPKNLSKSAEPLIVKRNDVILIARNVF